MIGVVIPDYKMPDASNSLRRQIDTMSKYPHLTLVVAQGYCLNIPPVLSTSERLEMTGAINLALTWFDIQERLLGEKFFAYWIVTTSMVFLDKDKDYLTPMVEFMQRNPDVVMTSPSVENTAWDSMKNQGGGCTRKVWGVDNIALLIRADWFNSIGRYDPDLTIGWGSSLETCYFARKAGKKIYVFDDLPMSKLDGIAHELDKRDGETREERNKKGSAEMHKVLGAKYGSNFLEILGHDYR